MLRRWWRTKKAERDLRRTERIYDRALNKAKRDHVEREELRALEWEESHFVGEAWKERNYVISRELRSEAARLNVPVPEFTETDMWREPEPHDSRRILSDRGIAAIRQAIRDERKARGLHPSIIVVAISALAALVGALAGLWEFFAE